VTRIQLPAVVGALLVALSLSACGGAPTDASKTEFCAAAANRSWVDDLGSDPDGEAIVDGLQKWGDELTEVGTPEGISDDARKGFEITVDYLGDLDPDDFEDLDDVGSLVDDLSDDEQEKVDAFNEYVTESCVPES